MGFFENLGRKVGEFTHEAKRAADQDAAYACTDCGERFHAAQEECPACGSDAITERQPSSADEGPGPDPNSSTESDAEPSAVDGQEGVDGDGRTTE
ncbi:zinc ribbon domain-containing protein [Halopiger thermotolerans]